MADNVHVFTDDQLKELISQLVPQPTVLGTVEKTAGNLSRYTVAEFEQMAKDARATIEHVPGAAKQLQADVKHNWILLSVAALSVMNTFFIIKDIFHGF